MPYAECRYAECRYAECRYTECRYAECRYAECRHDGCRYAAFSTVIMSLANAGCAKTVKLKRQQREKNVFNKVFLC
jgi:hypothetical protein